jgi:hypothetical protein
MEGDTFIHQSTVCSLFRPCPLATLSTLRACPSCRLRSAVFTDLHFPLATKHQPSYHSVQIERVCNLQVRSFSLRSKKGPALQLAKLAEGHLCNTMRSFGRIIHGAGACLEGAGKTTDGRPDGVGGFMQ